MEGGDDITSSFSAKTVISRQLFSPFNFFLLFFTSLIAVKLIAKVSVACEASMSIFLL